MPEGDSAPDGNLAFAYALLLADKQWGSTGKVNYLDEAKKTANAIKLYEMNPRKLPGLGDWASLPGEGMWTTVATPPNYAAGPLPRVRQGQRRHVLDGGGGRDPRRRSPTSRPGSRR